MLPEWRSLAHWGMTIVFFHILVLNLTGASKLEALRSIRNLKRQRSQFSEMKRVLEEIDADLLKQQKRTCALNGGMSTFCFGENIHDKMNAYEYLGSHKSPGRRTIRSTRDLHAWRKRTCSVNGGMNPFCLISDLDAKLNAQEKLGSKFGPGKKRDSKPKSRKRRSIYWTGPCPSGTGTCSYPLVPASQPSPSIGNTGNMYGVNTGLGKPNFGGFGEPFKRAQSNSNFYLTDENPYAFYKRGNTADMDRFYFNDDESMSNFYKRDGEDGEFDMFVQGEDVGLGEDSESVLRSIARKRSGISSLKRLLSNLDARLHKQQKRACLMNLGHSCDVESAAAAADTWKYLNSVHSPGRRRRDTRAANKDRNTDEADDKREVTDDNPADEEKREEETAASDESKANKREEGVKHKGGSFYSFYPSRRSEDWQSSDGDDASRFYSKFYKLVPFY
ncbi:uncharacterized protein LOC106163882 [Lingula anatina]|uniref:Uncharacterized protein LOC106163882 n=1 Tax=Lingula anatina TaxID=7574 RepID=A0A1S3IHT3_LINAN|nr:uncharacterized protein LOC106163882 [Lingula anatina]|eukprot:XP_013397049.1 uncharacterized protein LOC106163882 [Lingula anatina]